MDRRALGARLAPPSSEIPLDRLLLAAAPPLPSLSGSLLPPRGTPLDSIAQRADVQMQDFMRLYSGLVERCFNACAQDFTSKALTSNEVSAGVAREVWVEVVDMPWS